VSVSIRVYIRDGQLESETAHALGSAITEIKFVWTSYVVDAILEVVIVAKSQVSYTTTVNKTSSVIVV
jgi:hypothetical protein